MIDFLQYLDVSIFWFLNTTTANPVFDKIMPFVTERNHWFILYIYLFFFFFLKLGKTGRIAAILAIIAVALSDQTASSMLKPLVARLRPSHELEGVRLLVGKGGQYGFPSSHAANFFAAAMVFTLYFPKYKWVYLGVAFIVSYSRIYVGVHYPADIIGGALIGIFYAWLLFMIANKIDAYFVNQKINSNNRSS